MLCLKYDWKYLVHTTVFVIQVIEIVLKVMLALCAHVLLSLIVKKLFLIGQFKLPCLVLYFIFVFFLNFCQSINDLASALSKVRLDPNTLIRICWPKDLCTLLRDDVVLVDR